MRLAKPVRVETLQLGTWFRHWSGSVCVVVEKNFSRVILLEKAVGRREVSPAMEVEEILGWESLTNGSEK